jgi:hypothetical protein
MSHKTSNYDLNIWDVRGYETNHREEGWAIHVYQFPYVGDSYGSGRFMERLSITLTELEVKKLTLGWGKELGGDHYEDNDFWIDKDTFFTTYTEIPERVATLLRDLPEYEQLDRLAPIV